MSSSQWDWARGEPSSSCALGSNRHFAQTVKRNDTALLTQPWGKVFYFGHSERNADFGHPFSHVFSPVTSVWRGRRAKRYNRPFSNTIAFPRVGWPTKSFVSRRAADWRAFSVSGSH
jgi:hypothetical protein